MLGQDPPTYRRSIDRQAFPLRGQRPGQELAGCPTAQDDHVVFFGDRHGLLRNWVWICTPASRAEVGGEKSV